MGVPEGSGDERVERAARSNDPLIGTTINGKFLVERAIARGGMGRIYFGRQAPLDRPVALKIVRADASMNEEESQFLKRFLLEASILAKLQHPNVVTLFDYGRIEGAAVEMYFIAMEFLDGDTLAWRLRTRGPLGTAETLALFRQLARGLREAHGHGIVHRDLKPSNIVIVPEPDGEIIKLVDFGIGKVEVGGEDLTREGVLVGTPKYMGPEQFDGQSSPASDVYALGVIIFQCLAGELPFPGNTLPEVMVSKLQRDVPPLRELNPMTDCPASLEELLGSMLARRPEDRPTLDMVFEGLTACEDDFFGGSGRRPPPTGSHRRSSAPMKAAPAVATKPASDASPEITTSADATLLSASAASPPMTGFTPRPMSTSARPPRSAKRYPPLAIPFALLLLGLAAIAAWFKTRTHEDAVADVESGIAVTSSTSAAKPAATPFVLRIQSTPPGAVVVEDNTVLGVTPLNVQVDPSSVATGPRVFVLKKEGFADKPIAQGMAEGDLEKRVALTVDPRAAKPATDGKAPTTKTSPPKADGGEDIRRNR